MDSELHTTEKAPLHYHRPFKINNRHNGGQETKACLWNFSQISNIAQSSLFDVEQEAWVQQGMLSGRAYDESIWKGSMKKMREEG